MFAGDNGLAVGSHGLLGKQNLYEHSVRVPLLIAGPGIPAGERRATFAYLFDLSPTLTELLGLEAPRSVEGRSLVPALDEDVAVRSAAFYAYRDLQRGVCDGDWKLIEYHVDGARHSQLFQVSVDPFETRDLAGSADAAPLLARMRRLLADQGRQFGDPLDVTREDWGKPPPERPSAIEHLAIGKDIQLSTPFSPKYPGAGAAGLVDGFRGVRDHAHSSWHGLEASDLEAVLDLGEAREVREVGLGSLRQLGSWIFPPTQWQVAVSLDENSENWLPPVSNPDPREGDRAGLTDTVSTFEPRLARYIRVRASSQMRGPEWHRGAGGKACSSSTRSGSAEQPGLAGARSRRVQIRVNWSEPGPAGDRTTRDNRANHPASAMSCRTVATRTGKPCPEESPSHGGTPGRGF